MMIANQSPWLYLREGIGEEATDLLGATNSDWGSRDANSRGREIPSETRALLFSFIGNHATNPDNALAQVKLSMYMAGGVALVVGTYNLIFGDLRCVYKPRRYTDGATGAKSKYAEDIAEVSQNWIATPQISGNGTDTCAILAVKTYCAAYVTAEILSVGTGITVDVLMKAINELP
jgi:hypothetical protein